MSNLFGRTLATAVLLVWTCLASGQSSEAFQLQAGAYRGQIQWEQSFDRTNWASVTAGTKDSLSVRPEKTTFYRAKITEQGCSPIYSDTKAVYIEGSLVMGGKLVSGKLRLPDGSSIKPSDVSVQSMLDKVSLHADASFEILIPDAGEENLLVASFNNHLLMLGYYTGTTNEFDINSQSTAMALLVLYPLLRPVPASRKAELMQLYAAQPEFAQLVNVVDSLIKNGKGTLIQHDTNTARLVAQLINKDYNKDRFRLSGNQKIQTGEEVAVTTRGSKVIFRNDASYSYGVSIYKKDASTPLTSFALSGSLLEESVITKSIISFITGIDISPTATIDLNDFVAESGNYILRIRSGLSGEGGQTDELALYQNIATLSVSLLDNFASPVLERVKIDECLKTMLSAVYTKTKVLLTGTLDPSKLEPDYILKEFVLPTIKDELKNLVHCSNRRPDQLLASLTEMLEHILESLDVLPVLTMNGAWLLGTRAIDHCKYLQPDNTIVNCFSFEKAAEPGSHNDACDTIVLKMRAVEDKRYYPYKGEAVPNLNFSWVTTSGNGVFPPDNSINLPGKTDDFGEASVKWILPNTNSTNSASAVLLNKTDVYAKADFSTTTVIPRPKFVTGDKSDHQVGAVNHYLPNKITISINDQNDGLPMYMDRFNVEWEVKGGGSVEFDPSSSTPLFSSWAWKLGPSTGEQSVSFTFTSKRCDFVIEGNPVTFKATATSGYSFGMISGDDQSNYVGKKLSNPIVVQVLDVDKKPVEGVDIRWDLDDASGSASGDTKTNASGTANINWKLGTQAGDQTLRVKALYNNEEIEGSPLIFKAVAKEAVYTLAKLSGDNQSGQAGTSLSNPLVVKVTDADNEAAPDGFVVKWSTSSGSIPSTSATVNGAAKAEWTLGSTTGEQTVTANAYSSSGKEISGSPINFKATALGPIVLTTSNVTAITPTGALSGGIISDDGGATITARGICWSTTPHPTVDGLHTTDRFGTGSFTSTISNATVNTTYYVRAYATNSAGTAYGNEVSFTTIPKPSLKGLSYALVSYRFQPIPGYVNTATCNNPPYLGWVDVKILDFDETTYAITVLDTAGKKTIVGPYSYSIGAYYSDSLFLGEPYATDCTNSYGHQYAEGWGVKIPPGFDLRFGEYWPTRLVLDGHEIYRAQTGDEVYIKK